MATARWWRWRPGIGLQLTLSFLGVGALILTANLAVQQTIRITTTRVTTLAPAPAAVAVALPVVQPPAPTPAPDPEPAIDAELERRAQTFVRESERYENVVALRVSAASAVTRADVTQSANALRRAASEALRDQPQRAKVNARVDAYQTDGAALVTRADARRDQYREYSALIEALNERMQRPIDGAWKIMGRVIARQSLLTANQRFSEIRRGAAALATSDSYDETLPQQLAQSEQAFSAVLGQQDKQLARSQGDAWLTGMQQDTARLIEMRGAIVANDQALLQGRKTLVEEGAALRALIGALPARTLAAARAKTRATARDDATRRTAAAIEAPPAVPVEPAVAAPELVTTSVDPGDAQSRSRLAWWSALTLLLLLAVLTATVLGIVVPVRRLIRATQSIARGDIAARVPRGGSKELDGLAIAFNDMAEQLTGAQALTRDYQQRLEADVLERTRQLQHLVEHDPLTSLPNRRQLFSYLTVALAEAAQRGQHVGLFFLDLDNFKNINDGMGHFLGDRVLEAIAERLRRTIDAASFAARLGGDEFTIVHGGGRTLEEITQAGWALVKAFQEPLQLDGRELLVSVSVGAAFFPLHASDADSLLRAADAALFRAKVLGRSQMSVFTPELLEAAATKFSTEQGLRHAVERGELELVYQPEVSLTSLETTVVEALLRWRTADGMQLSPGVFLAVAEESGLIIEINDWVLRSGVMAAARWHHGEWPEVRVAINVSSRQLFDSKFADRVQDLLTEHRLPARCLEIELTETVLQTGPTTIEGLRRLRAMGVSIALDDFGTGYSSLASLEQLPLDRVKLDRSLIDSIDSNARSNAIASAIIGLCRDLDVQITAEGVERIEQLAALRDSGVHIQGFLVARPVADAEVLATIRALPDTLQNLLLDAPVAALPCLREARINGELVTDTQRRRALRISRQG